MSDPNEPPDSGDDRPPPPPPPPPEGGGYPPPPPASGGYPPPQQPPQQPPAQPYGQPQYGQPQYGQQQPWGQPYQPQYTGPVEKVPNYLVQAILVTLFCCLPAGIVAIVFAAQVNGKLESGDIAGARSASRNAKIWSWVSLGVGLFFAVGYLLLIIVAGVFGETSSNFNGDF